MLRQGHSEASAAQKYLLDWAQDKWGADVDPLTIRELHKDEVIYDYEWDKSQRREANIIEAKQKQDAAALKRAEKMARKKENLARKAAIEAAAAAAAAGAPAAEPPTEP